MPHTRSQGSPKSTFSEEPERDFHTRLRSKLSQVRPRASLPFSISPLHSHTPLPISFSLSSSSTSPTHTPPSSPTSLSSSSEMADPNPPRRTVHERATDGFTGIRNPLARPDIANTNTWQFPSYIMNSITNSTQFNGLDDEDAPGHISKFVRICNTFHLQGVDQSVIYLQLFPFSLASRASTWFDTLTQNSIATWDDLRAKFLQKYYPPHKAARLRDQIHSFHMDPDEPYCTAWERFHNLLSKCPQHGLSDWALVEKFYNGLTFQTQLMFNTAAGGHIMERKDIDECVEMFESFARAEQQQRPSVRNSIPKTSNTSSATRGVYQVTPDASLAAAIEALAKDVKEMKTQMKKCEICRGGHETAECPVTDQEQLDSINSGWHKPPVLNSNFNSNSNWNSNPNWRNNNSNWRGGNSSGYQPRQPLFPNSNSGGAPPPASSSSGSTSIDDIAAMISKQTNLLENLNSKVQEHDTLIKGQITAYHNLEAKVGELASKVNERPQGGLPSNTVNNPKPPYQNAHVNAVITRSGRGVPAPSAGADEGPVDEEIEMEDSNGKVQPRLSPASTAQPDGSSVEKEKNKVPEKVYKPTPPYPGRLRKNPDSECCPRFLDMLKKLHVNIPFLEALSKMPKYAKFLKDLLTNKKKLEELSTMILNERCSAILQNKLPEKKSDSGSFTIPCLMGNLGVHRALADLGASVNLMPYSVYAKLNLGELAPTRMVLQFADRSIKCPRGIVENILVKVDKFVYPVDFVVLDMEEDSNVPLILGRPFLATARALIDVHDGKLTLRVDDEAVTFNSLNSKDNSTEKHEAYVKEVTELKCGDKVFLDKSWMKMFPRKLKSHRHGPFLVKDVSPHGTIEIEAEDGKSWKVNRHRLKKYFGVPIGDREVEAIYHDPL